MRAMRTIRVPTAAKLAVGASVLAFPATAMAVTSASGNANATAPAATPATALHGVHNLALPYGHKTFIRGTAPARDAGTPLELEYRAANGRRWRTLATGHVHRNGHFALSARLVRSGHIQVLPVLRTQAQTATTTAGAPGANRVAATPAPASTDSAAPIPLRASVVSHVSVRPELKLGARHATAIIGSAAHVGGRMLPAVGGRRLVLEARRGHRWVVLGRTRTGRGGRFHFAFTPGWSAGETVHVAFAGDRLNSRAVSGTEAITPMQYAEVSWYYDAGNTACGFHATYGIASRTLPCGSKVTMSYGGRSVVATVDDRGPFVYSRLYDLNQNTAAALGMSGVATVLASV